MTELMKQESLSLNTSQLEKFRRLRHTMLGNISHLSLGESCIMDLVRDMLDTVPMLENPLTVDNNLNLLNQGKLYSAVNRQP